MKKQSESSVQRMHEFSKDFGTNYQRCFNEGYQKGMQDEEALDGLKKKYESTCKELGLNIKSYLAIRNEFAKHQNLLKELVPFIEELQYPEAKNREQSAYNKAIYDAVRRISSLQSYLEALLVEFEKSPIEVPASDVVVQNIKHELEIHRETEGEHPLAEDCMKLISRIESDKKKMDQAERCLQQLTFKPCDVANCVELADKALGSLRGT